MIYCLNDFWDRARQLPSAVFIRLEDVITVELSHQLGISYRSPPIPLIHRLFSQFNLQPVKFLRFRRSPISCSKFGEALVKTQFINMEPQNYKNHVQFYAPHHFVFYPLSLVLTAIAVYKMATTAGEIRNIWIFVTLILLLIIWVSFMMRQHYALTLQNRIVRLEMRHKYSMLTGKDFEPLEEKLKFGQIAAIRFASDEELIPLINKTLKENLSPKVIKKSIKKWNPDYRRV